MKRFRLNETKPIKTPITCGEVLIIYDGTKKANKMEYKSIMSSLIFLCNTKQNIFFVVFQYFRFILDPSHLYLNMTKRILRYVRGTID